MADLKSISAKQITAAAKSSVAKVLEQNKSLQSRPVTVGFVQPYSWIGLILRDGAQLERVADVQKVAADIHAGVAAVEPGLKAGTSGAIIRNRDIIVGFLPPREIEVIEE